MGIVNVTPDSFSDGGKFLDPDAAIEHGMQLAAEGAEILDIGGESTRPNAEPVPVEEELRRVSPVIKTLAERSGKVISIDTYKPAVARAAVALGASIINDIAGNRSGSEMWKLVAETGVGYVLMHMKGTPQTMQDHAQYADVVSEVETFLTETAKKVLSCGVRPEQLILDPGIGFSKTPEHNLQLLAALKRFKLLKRPLLIGASRKSFIGKLLGAQDRLPGSLGCAAWSAINGTQIIRTHDVASTIQIVRMIEEISAYQK